MATIAQTIAGRTFSFSWLGQFLKEELSPYPGRFSLVGRMVLATTLVMIVSMTFQLSFAFEGAILALLVSRESPRATFQSAWAMFLSIALGALYLLTSAWFVMSIPTLHLLWVLASFLLGFYVLSALNNYAAASIFTVMIAVGVPLWDRYVPAERNVEDTLRLAMSAVIGIAVTLIIERVFVHWRPGEHIIQPTVERLDAVEGLLACIAEGRECGEATAHITRLGMVGTSRLRRILRRSTYAPHFAEQMSSLVALTGTMVDTADNLTLPNSPLSEDVKIRVRRLVRNIATIRTDLRAGKTPHLSEPFPERSPLTALPFLPQMERAVSLIPDAFVGSHPLNVYAPLPLSGDPPQRLFAWDTRSNGDHIRFALKGCLTAGLCYVFYNLVDWQGLSPSLPTCFLTALSTIGGSRQRQLLRFAGAAVGGFGFAMASQIFILPHLNSIAGFAVLFVIITALCSWVMTASSWLSYFGLQMAFAYYIAELQEFTIQPSLLIVRDRVVAVLFGLLMMWFVFDWLWAAPAVVAMKNGFIADLRLIAQLAREPVSTNLSVATERYFSLREMINTNYGSVRSSADSVLLEFGPSRQQSLVWRRRVLDWQMQLRTLFLTQVSLWKYRAGLPGFELSEPLRLAQKEFDDQTANMLNEIADRMEGKAPAQETDLKKTLAHLDQAIQAFRSEHPHDALAPQIQTYIPLSARAESLATSLNHTIGETVL